jgi:hypothetical protein
MEYRKIVSVTGLPGLFEIISSKTDGAIVRSLDDKATKFVSSRTHNLSHLESIEVYTVNDNVNLSEIFFAIEKAGTKLPEEKDAGAVKKFFEKVYPELDFERVYNSDMKKMVRWYGILKEHNIEVKLPEEQVEETEVEEPAEEEKPVKKAKAKKTEEVEEVKEPKSRKAEKPEEVKEPKIKKAEKTEVEKPAKPAAKAKKADAPADKPAEKTAPKKSAKKK